MKATDTLTGLRLSCVVAAALVVWSCGEDEPSQEPFDYDAFIQELTGFPPVPDARDIPELDTGPPRLIDGQPCQRDDICYSGTCLLDSDNPRGYCTLLDCVTDADCPEDGRGVCAVGTNGRNLCAPPCSTAADCRDGYECRGSVVSSQSVCLWPPPAEPEPALDGEPCRQDRDCEGGTCLEDPDWPGGYCTSLNCESVNDCAGSAGVQSRCWLTPAQTFCVVDCDTDSDCRGGYACQAYARGLNRCAPTVANPVDPDVPAPEPAGSPIPLTCIVPAERDVSISFTVSERARSWMVGYFSRDGLSIEGRSLSTPTRAIDFGTSEGVYLNFTSLLFGSAGAILMPGTPAFAADVAPGLHTLRINTRSQNLCWYLIEEETAGARIDFNIYLVGVPGVTAATAPDDANFVRLLGIVDDILSPSGVQVGTVRYFDVPDDVADRYAIIRDGEDVQDLAIRTVSPGPEVSDALSLNVFFTQGFSFRDAAGVIGISSGLPGLAGMHGTVASAVAFTSEYLDRGDEDLELTAVVFAHEVGHFLGLFHTSEFYSDSTDPLSDTPACGPLIRSDPESCPDWRNLMFPFAGPDHTLLSAEQATIIRANPLSRD